MKRKKVKVKKVIASKDLTTEQLKSILDNWKGVEHCVSYFKWEKAKDDKGKDVPALSKEGNGFISDGFDKQCAVSLIIQLMSKFQIDLTIISMAYNPPTDEEIKMKGDLK